MCSGYIHLSYSKTWISAGNIYYIYIYISGLCWMDFIITPYKEVYRLPTV